MSGWGLESESNELFKWMDLDKDGKVSYNDLRLTVGVEIAPME